MKEYCEWACIFQVYCCTRLLVIHERLGCFISGGPEQRGRGREPASYIHRKNRWFRKSDRDASHDATDWCGTGDLTRSSSLERSPHSQLPALSRHGCFCRITSNGHDFPLLFRLFFSLVPDLCSIVSRMSLTTWVRVQWLYQERLWGGFPPEGCRLADF